MSLKDVQYVYWGDCKSSSEWNLVGKSAQWNAQSLTTDASSLTTVGDNFHPGYKLLKEANNVSFSSRVEGLSVP